RDLREPAPGRSPPRLVRARPAARAPPRYRPLPPERVLDPGAGPGPGRAPRARLSLQAAPGPARGTGGPGSLLPPLVHAQEAAEAPPSEAGGRDRFPGLRRRPGPHRRHDPVALPAALAGPDAWRLLLPG